MAKQYLDEHGLGVYHENLINLIENETSNLVQETISSTAPQTAATGDFWTELITNNE